MRFVSNDGIGFCLSLAVACETNAIAMFDSIEAKMPFYSLLNSHFSGTPDFASYSHTSIYIYIFFRSHLFASQHSDLGNFSFINFLYKLYFNKLSLIGLFHASTSCPSHSVLIYFSRHHRRRRRRQKNPKMFSISFRMCDRIGSIRSTENGVNERMQSNKCNSIGDAIQQHNNNIYINICVE